MRCITCNGNDELAQFVDTSDAWITERTGIKRRHIAENETVSSLAVCAAKKHFWMQKF